MIELNKIYCGDCQTVMRDIDSDSVDCIVTDPPYGMSFMGKNWDKAVPSVEIWQECLRVLKPGAFAFVMCIPRQDCLARMICRLEDAGFNVAFSSIYHTFASGFPKAQNVSKQIDKRNGRHPDNLTVRKYLRKKRKESGKTLLDINKAIGTSGMAEHLFGNSQPALPSIKQWQILKYELNLDNRFDELIEREEAEREVIGKGKAGLGKGRPAHDGGYKKVYDITKSATSQAKALDGAYSGMQLKPAVEIVIVAMKPLEEKTYLAQAISNKHGCTWLDDCRIPFEKKENSETVTRKPSRLKKDAISYVRQDEPLFGGTGHQKGRFPANVICGDNVLDDGIERKSGDGNKNSIRSDYKSNTFTIHRDYIAPSSGGDKGSFSRYFSLDAWFAERIKQLPKEAQKTFPFMLIPKASKSEKDRGLKGESNIHPTCKNIKLMSWLITLVSREGDTVLDPFCGSGTTAIAAKMLGRQYIGIEREEEYYETARKRVSAIPTNLSRFQ